jgi:hypothetical protein
MREKLGQRTIVSNIREYCSLAPISAPISSLESKNLEGGIYGKGPFKKFGLSSSSCWRSEWVEITREEFKKLATEWYGYDWSNEIPYWSK